MTAMHTEHFADEHVTHIGVPVLDDEAVDVEVVGTVVTVRFHLPEDVDATRVTATYAHGAIELHAPRQHKHFAVNADASGV